MSSWRRHLGFRRSTQWDDIQCRLGNLPPKPAPFKPTPFVPADDPDLRPKSKDWIDERSPEELEDLEDDLDDDRFLREYRKKRLAELRETARVARFGSVVPISGSDFVREVSQAPPDVWVVVFLYKDGSLKKEYDDLNSKTLEAEKEVKLVQMKIQDTKAHLSKLQKDMDG
uniref:Phosducin domain-containing protein n=1 Tax=Ananas comosus var. bracteatus TaxID=296719 RepID=A0A6V7NRC8_ANACO|nr:unnamed protein product [Ananas comosus var. bracteatus]